MSNMYAPTVDDVLALKPCEAYTREHITELLARGFTAETLGSIPYADARWVLVRLLATPTRQREWARACARSVLHLWSAPDVVVRYLETGDEVLRAEAGSAAAYAAAYAAADAAAAAAAYAAAYAADDAAAYAADDAAAYAYAAASAAARKQKQLE